jgi:hypothetical protein
MHAFCRGILNIFKSGTTVDRRRSAVSGARHLSTLEFLEVRQVLAANALQAVHRSGQTFLTWAEDGSVTGEQYNVYRSSSPITTATLGQAEKLTAKWGPLDDNTSVNTGAAPGTEVPANFVIQDLGTPLSDSTGLFVYTTPAAQSGTWYYAVTQVNSGIENTSLAAGVNTLITGVSETVAAPAPVLTYSVNSGKGRIYTQYMDYAKWNPTFQGYAYNYSVALPYNYDTNQQWPIRLMPHAYGERFRLEPEAEYQWQSIEVFLDDPGSLTNGTQTWWYGFAADHNYVTGGEIPTTGQVENFTEQRILKTVDEVSTLFSVNRQHIISQGHSMGGSGSLSLGIRYGNVMSAIFASEPMTNYQSSPTFSGSFEQLWGSKAANLPIVNNGTYAGPLKQYDGLGVYDWMNHQSRLLAQRGMDTAFLMVGHGKSDFTIDWNTQGKPFIQTLNSANVGFTAEQRFGWDHTWMGFGYVPMHVMSPTGSGDLHDYAYDRQLSFPSVTNATGSGPLVPGVSGTNEYNLQIEWSGPVNNFHTGIVDTLTRYEITLRSTSTAQVAEVTPRRLQQFAAPAGTVVRWKNINNATGLMVQSGTVTSDANGLVTIPRMQIGTGTGNRLRLEIGDAVPVISQPGAVTQDQTPDFRWSVTTDAVSYDVWINNLSNTSAPAQRFNVSGTSWTPTTAMGIGRYRVWVRGVRANSTTTAWSAATTFQINTSVALNDMPPAVNTATPTVSWAAVPGAVRYDLWMDRRTPQQAQFIRQTNIQSTSFQIPSALPMGTYFVWVRAIDAGGFATPWSAGESFNVATRAVLSGPELSTFDTTPDFQWQTVLGAGSYEVLVQNRQTNATVANPTGVTGTTWSPSVPMADGEYRWFVRAYGPAGIVGAWSEVRSLNVGGKPILLTPPGQASSRTPLFSWSAVQNAVRYELWVSRIGVGTVINLTNLTNTSYTPTSDLATGTYRIWVRAVSGTAQTSGWSTPVDIIVVSTDTVADESRTVLTSVAVPSVLDSDGSSRQGASNAGEHAKPIRIVSPQPSAAVTPQEEASAGHHAAEVIDVVFECWTDADNIAAVNSPA